MQKGYLCKLTGEQPNFENNCPDFNINERKKEEKLAPIIAYIEKNLEWQSPKWKEDGRYWCNFLVADGFKKSPVKVNPPLLIRFKKRKKIHLLVGGAFMLGITAYILFQDWPVYWGSIVALAFFTILGSLCIFDFFKTGGGVLLNEDGVRINENGLIRWSDILYAYFKIVQSGQGERMDYLIIKLHNGEETKLEISALERGEQLGTLLWTFMREYKDN